MAVLSNRAFSAAFLGTADVAQSPLVSWNGLIKSSWASYQALHGCVCIHMYAWHIHKCASVCAYSYTDRHTQTTKRNDSIWNPKHFVLIALVYLSGVPSVSLHRDSSDNSPFCTDSMKGFSWTAAFIVLRKRERAHVHKQTADPADLAGHVSSEFLSCQLRMLKLQLANTILPEWQDIA